jgi:hypothetical protein
MRLIDADKMFQKVWNGSDDVYTVNDVLELIDEQPTIAASPWHRGEEKPKEAGEYIVAYHPCYWDNVVTKVTKVGIDNFRGKSAWAKKKFQRVTHWMEKPEPPKEDA